MTISYQIFHPKTCDFDLSYFIPDFHGIFFYQNIGFTVYGVDYWEKIEVMMWNINLQYLFQ